MLTEKEDLINFNDMSTKAIQIVRILGSISLETDFVFSEDEVNQIIAELKINEEKNLIHEKLKSLGILPSKEEHD